MCNARQGNYVFCTYLDWSPHESTHIWNKNYTIQWNSVLHLVCTEYKKPLKLYSTFITIARNCIHFQYVEGCDSNTGRDLLPCSVIHIISSIYRWCLINQITLVVVSICAQLLLRYHATKKGEYSLVFFMDQFHHLLPFPYIIWPETKH